MSTQAAEIQTTDSIFYHLTETGHHYCTATDATARSPVLSPEIKKNSL
jgi:hypothetical protein